MSLHIGLVREFVTLKTRCANYQLEHSFHANIEVTLGKFTILYGLQNTLVVEHFARHHKVVAGGNLLNHIVATVPVGHNQTFEAPLVAQNGLEKSRILRCVATVDIVVRGHNCPRLRLLYCNLEVAKIDLSQGTQRQSRVVCQTVDFLAVNRKVFERCTHAVALHSVDHRGGSFARQERIFGVVLEVATAEWISHNVYAWCKQYINTILFYLLTDCGTYIVDDFVVPGRSEMDTHREACAVVGLRVAFASWRNA